MNSLGSGLAWLVRCCVLDFCGHGAFMFIPRLRFGELMVPSGGILVLYLLPACMLEGVTDYLFVGNK